MFKKGETVETTGGLVVKVTKNQCDEFSFSGLIVAGGELGHSSDAWASEKFTLREKESSYSVEQLQKHGSVILEYLKGEVIEVSGDERWEVCDTPFFSTGLEYRVQVWDPKYLEPISLPDGSTRVFVRKVNERFYTLPSDPTGKLIKTDSMFLALEYYDEIFKLKK